MGKRVVRRRIYPELYVHFELKRKLSRNEESRIQAQLAEVSENVFWELFGRPAWSGYEDRDFSVENRIRQTEKISKPNLREQTQKDYEMTVILEEGSLKVKIVSGLTTLYFAIGAWGSFVSGADDIASRLRWAFDNLLPQVHQIIGHNNIQEEIRHERRIGAIGRLDELIQLYQDHKIQEEDFIEEGNAILEKIANSEDREVLIPLVSHYVGQEYGIEMQDFRLPEGLPQTPPQAPYDDNEPPPIDLGPLPDQPRRIRRRFTF